MKQTLAMAYTSTMTFFVMMMMMTLMFACNSVTAFQITPRPGIVRIVALPMSEEQQLVSKTMLDYNSIDSAASYPETYHNIDDDSYHRNAITTAPSFDEYMNQRAGSGL